MQESPTKRLLIGFAITLAAVLLYSGYTLRQFRMLRELQAENIDRNRKDSLQLLRIQNSLNSLAVTFRDMASGEDPYPVVAFEPQVTRIRADLEDALRIEDTLVPRAHRSAQQNSVTSALAGLWSATDRMFTLAREGKDREARYMIRTSMQGSQTALSAMIARLLVENNAAEDQAAQSVQQIYNHVERTLFGFLAAEVLAIVFTSIALVYFNRRIFDRLALLTEQKTTLAHKLISVQEDFLRNISRELHDEFGQILTAIGQLLARADRKFVPPESPLHDAMQEVREITQEALEKVRTLSHALHPGIIDDYGLEKAIEWYLPKFEAQTGMKIVYQKEGSGAGIPEQAAIHVYRILQEALNNVARHARSRAAVVRVRYEETGLHLQVEDHGVGMGAAGEGARGLGLVAMRERAGLLGGRLTVQGASPCGTLVTLDVPLGKTAPHEREDHSSAGR